MRLLIAIVFGLAVLGCSKQSEGQCCQPPGDAYSAVLQNSCKSRLRVGNRFQLQVGLINITQVERSVAGNASQTATTGGGKRKGPLRRLFGRR